MRIEFTTSDDLSDINSITSGDVYLTSGTYDVDETIIVNEGVSLTMASGAVLELSEDVDVIDLDNGAVLRGGTIDTSQITYSKAAILLDGTNQYRPHEAVTLIDGVEILGTNTDSGTGILIDATDSGGWSFAVGVRVSNVNIANMETGIKLDVEEPTQDLNFINGCHFNDIWLTYCPYSIEMLGSWATGEQVNANSFSGINVQAAASSVRALNCEGGYNYFESFTIWDWPTEGEPAAIIFATNTPGNRLYGYVPATWMVQDNGTNTVLSPFWSGSLLQE